MFGVLAAIPFGRFLILWFAGGETAGMVQLVIFGLMMAVDALNSLTLRVLSDLLSINRVLIEEHTSGSRRCSAA